MMIHYLWKSLILKNHSALESNVELFFDFSIVMTEALS